MEAVRTVAGETAFEPYVGLTIEIAFMFAVAPLVVLDVLPEDREPRYAVTIQYGRRYEPWVVDVRPLEVNR